jgi:hypothetical protein
MIRLLGLQEHGTPVVIPHSNDISVDPDRPCRQDNHRLGCLPLLGFRRQMLYRRITHARIEEAISG